MRFSRTNEDVTLEDAGSTCGSMLLRDEISCKPQVVFVYKRRIMLRYVLVEEIWRIPLPDLIS